MTLAWRGSPTCSSPRRAALVLPRDGGQLRPYGLIKKKVETGRRYQPLSGVLVQLPVALLIIGWLTLRGTSQFYGW